MNKLKQPQKALFYTGELKTALHLSAHIDNHAWESAKNIITTAAEKHIGIKK